MKARFLTWGRRRRARVLQPLLVMVASLVSVCAFPRMALAGGLYLMPRGVEAASRGGARVAGSNDPQALWYNPAGLLSSGRQLLVDALLPLMRSEFTRVLDNGTVEPTVRSSSAIPIPTIAYSDNFGLKRWGFGFGLLIPPAAGGEWPETVNGQRAPQRYSALPGEGSLYATLALGAAYSPIDRLSLGAALYVSLAQVGGTVAMSVCDYAICLQPEAPEWEGRTSFRLGPMVTASAVFGATYDFDFIKLGASLQLRTKIEGEGSFDVALPDQAVFDDVEIKNGNCETGKCTDDLRARTEAELPMVIRLGVEVHPIKPLKVELAGTWENWSNQKSVTVDPVNVWLHNVPGLGTSEADSVTLARNARDTWAANIGTNYDLAPLFNLTRALSANLGLMFESSSVRERDLSVGTLDTRKVMLALGASVEVARNVLIDVTYGHIFMKNHTVTHSEVLLPAAVKPLPQDDDPNTYDAGDRPAIGNGRYKMEADFVGVGVRWKLDPLQRDKAAPPDAAKQVAPAPQSAPVPVAMEPPAWDPEPVVVPPPPAAPAPDAEPQAAPALVAPAPEAPAPESPASPLAP